MQIKLSFRNESSLRVLSFLFLSAELQSYLCRLTKRIGSNNVTSTVTSQRSNNEDNCSLSISLDGEISTKNGELTIVHKVVDSYLTALSLYRGPLTMGHMTDSLSKIWLFKSICLSSILYFASLVSYGLVKISSRYSEEQLFTLATCVTSTSEYFKPLCNTISSLFYRLSFSNTSIVGTVWTREALALYTLFLAYYLTSKNCNLIIYMNINK